MDYKKLIVESGKEIVKRGFTVETWGNISAFDAEEGKVYLTPSAMKYDSISEEDVVVLDLEGNVLEGNRKPTIETGMHLGLYKARKDIRAIIHTHPMYSMIYACQGKNIPQFTDEAAQGLGGEVLCTAQYQLPGTAELAEEVVKAMPAEHMACLIRNHGAVCAGRDMNEAFKTATILEVTAQLLYMIESTGGRPIGIAQENIDYMWDFARNKYGQGK